MSEVIKNNPLRVVAALILGVVVGVIGFFIVALFFGLIEDMSGFKTGITANFSENMLSAVLLLIFVIAGAGYFYWKVSTTPASKELVETE